MTGITPEAVAAMLKRLRLAARERLPIAEEAADMLEALAARKPMPVPQEGDVWVLERTRSALPAYLDDPLAADLIAEGYRLFREVKA
jgi:hypothetical protein